MSEEQAGPRKIKFYLLAGYICDANVKCSVSLQLKGCYPDDTKILVECTIIV